jgi:peptidoglycan/xylan/chitin deacetylase (PgdA/CDA1 family)
MTLRPNPIKKIVKRSLQHLAASFGKHTKSYQEPQLLVLMYHRILPHNDNRTRREEPGMMVTPESFRLHLNILKQHFNIIQLSKWVELKNKGVKLPTRTCAITFDDGWADNYEFAFPILRELEVPATIFLVSDMIGTSKLFWPERLAQIISTIALDHPDHWSHPALDWIYKMPTRYQFNKVAPTQEALSELIANAKVLPDYVIHSRLDKIEAVLKLSIAANDPSLLNWQQLSEMLASGLIEAGSHTCNHTRLDSNTDSDVLDYEIVTSKGQIEEKTGFAVKTFCFPNGDYSTEALALVRQHYGASVSTETGWNTAESDSHLLRRIGIHEDIAKDKVAFLARISGWM